MSVKATALVWDCGQFKGNRLLVLLALADHADHDGGNIFPSIDTVARKSRCSPRQVKRIIADLRDTGALVPLGSTKGGRGRSTRYRLDFDLLRAWAELPKDDDPDTLCDDGEDDGGNAADRKGDGKASGAARRKDDTSDTLSEKKGGHHGSERVTPVTEKGDKALSPEPSRTINNPRAAPLPDAGGDGTARGSGWPDGVPDDLPDDWPRNRVDGEPVPPWMIATGVIEAPDPIRDSARAMVRA